MAKLEIVNHSDTIGVRWITLVKGCLLFTLVLFKEIIQKINFSDRQLTQAVSERKQRPALRHYKADFISTTLSQPHPKALSRTMSLAEYLICLRFNNPCQTTPAWRKRYAFEQGNAFPNMLKKYVFDVHNTQPAPVSYNLGHLDPHQG